MGADAIALAAHDGLAARIPRQCASLLAGAAIRTCSSLDRGHRFAGQPGEGGDFSFQGDCLGAEAPMLQSVPVPLRRATTGAMHPADAMPPHRRRSAL